MNRIAPVLGSSFSNEIFNDGQMDNCLSHELCDLLPVEIMR